MARPDDHPPFQGQALSYFNTLFIYLFQGHNSSIAGMERSVTLEPVKNWYNVMFDIAFWVVLHLFVRGAFRDIQVNFFFPRLRTVLTLGDRPRKI